MEQSNNSKTSATSSHPVLKDLKAKIFLRIAVYERRRAKIRAYVFSSMSVCLLASVCVVVMSAIESIRNSGFYEYVSLIFSGEAIFSYWKELGLTLLETLPIMTLVSLCALCAVFLYCAFSALKLFTSLKKLQQA